MKMIPIQATYEARIPDVQDKSGELKHALSETHRHSQEQLDWLVAHIDAEWEHLAPFKTTDKMLTASEKLFHATKGNPEPKYPEYDEKYGYTPSYIRRSLFRKAIGHVKSHKSNHANWVAAGKRGDEPKLGR